MGKGGANLNALRMENGQCQFQLETDQSDQCFRYLKISGLIPDICSSFDSVGKLVSDQLESKGLKSLVLIYAKWAFGRTQ